MLLWEASRSPKNEDLGFADCLRLKVMLNSMSIDKVRKQFSLTFRQYPAPVGRRPKLLHLPIDRHGRVLYSCWSLRWTC